MLGAILDVGPKCLMLPIVGVGHGAMGLSVLCDGGRRGSRGSRWMTGPWGHGAVGLSVLCDNSVLKVHRYGEQQWCQIECGLYLKLIM